MRSAHLLRILTAVSVLLLLAPGWGRAAEPEAEDGAFEKTIPGVRVRFLDPLGNAQEVVGVLEREDETLLHVRSTERLHEIRRSRVLETHTVSLDPRTIYTSQQLLERYVAARRATHPGAPLLTTLDHWHAALYAQWLEAWEAAREHYALCAADPAFPRRVAATAEVERIDALLRQAAGLAVLDQAAFDIRRHLIRKARIALQGFSAAHADASEALRAKHGLLLKTLGLRREEVLTVRVQSAFPSAVRSLLGEQAREKDVAITDVVAWTRRELPDAARAQVAAKLRPVDDVSPEEVGRLWDGRCRYRGRGVATYGSGTYLVDPPPEAAPTRDAWWARVATRERNQWVLAFFVEHSGLFEVERRELPSCLQCRGAGRITKILPGGGTLTYTCPRCHGLGHDVVLHYR